MLIRQTCNDYKHLADARIIVAILMRSKLVVDDRCLKSHLIDNVPPLPITANNANNANNDRLRIMMKMFNCGYVLTALMLLTGCQSFQWVESPIPVTSQLAHTAIK